MFFEAAFQSMSKKSKILAYDITKIKLEVSKQILYLKQLKLGINSLVMLLKEMNLRILAFVKSKIKIYIQNSQKLGHIYLW